MKNAMKKTVKILKWSAIGMGVLFALVIVALIKDISNDDVQANQIKEVKTVEETKQIEKVDTNVQAIQTDKDNKESLEQITLGILQSSYSNANVTFDKEMKAYTILPTDDSMMLAITMVSNGGMKDDYNLLVDGFVELSKEIEKTLGSGYILSMNNPANPDNTLLMVMDGIVVYNFAQ